MHTYTIRAEGCYPRTITAATPREAGREYISRVRRRTEGLRQLSESDLIYADPDPEPDDEPCPACCDTLGGTIDQDGQCEACGHLMPAVD